MTCPTDKVRYRERADADRGLREVTRTQGYLRERRPYYCRSCHGWHLTSQARGGAAYTFDDGPRPSDPEALEAVEDFKLHLALTRLQGDLTDFLSAAERLRESMEGIDRGHQ